MNGRTSLTVSCFLVGLMGSLATTSASAQHQGSMEDQLACTPDVYRLCSNLIPDEDKIVQCLTRNKPNLSAECKKVFSEPGRGAQPTSPSDDDD